MVRTVLRAKSFWRNRSVLVTGGGGFIGSWLSHDLALLGARVVVLDIKNSFPYLGETQSAVLGKCTFVKGDIRDETVLRALFKKYLFETTFHLAARAIVEDVLAEPEESLDTNIRGAWRVLEAFRTLGPKSGHVVVASSDKAYGTHKTLPYREDFSLRGSGHPYDCSKSCADSVAQMYARVYRVPVCIMRCGNVYGGGDVHFTRLIPGTIRSLLREEGVTLRGNGKHKRDFLYIRDAVSAYMRAAEAMHARKKDVHGEAFNFGNGAPVSVLAVVRLVMQLMKKNHLKPTILSRDRHEIKDQYLDARKAKKILHWGPEYTLENGLKETIAWYREFLSHDKADVI